jgi:Amidase
LRDGNHAAKSNGATPATVKVSRKQADLTSRAFDILVMASSVTLVERTLARAELLQPLLQPFRVILAEQARAEAVRADERLAAGESAPLLGVPFAIKDDVDLAGEITPFGCGGEHLPAITDSELVRRLREAGAVIVGKTMTPEAGVRTCPTTRRSSPALRSRFGSAKRSVGCRCVSPVAWSPRCNAASVRSSTV